MVCKRVQTVSCFFAHKKKNEILICVSFPLKAHDTGLVTLQVAASSQIISNSVVFEYKARALPALPSSQHDWLSLDGTFRIYHILCIAVKQFWLCVFLGYFQQNRCNKII